MAKNEQEKAEAKVNRDPVGAAEAGNEQVQAQVDVENEAGFRGVEADPTPNENYTVDGVTSGAPTPETDPEQAKNVGSRRFDHVDEGR